MPDISRFLWYPHFDPFLRHFMRRCRLPYTCLSPFPVHSFAFSVSYVSNHFCIDIQSLETLEKYFRETDEYRCILDANARGVGYLTYPSHSSSESGLKVCGPPLIRKKGVLLKIVGTFALPKRHSNTRVRSSRNVFMHWRWNEILLVRCTTHWGC